MKTEAQVEVISCHGVSAAALSAVIARTVVDDGGAHNLVADSAVPLMTEMAGVITRNDETGRL